VKNTRCFCIWLLFDDQGFVKTSGASPLPKNVRILPPISGRFYPHSQTWAEIPPKTYEFRHAQREAETDYLGRSQLELIALRLRASWKAWHGEETLHKMAFGEPSSPPLE
jgi:hypothetical protein